MEERKYSASVCLCFHVYACHCEVAPACAVIAADRGRETANFSSGGKERRERWKVFDEQARCRGAKIHVQKPAGTERGGMTN